jgi:hypothetical protein
MAKAFKKNHFDEESLRRSAEASGATSAYFIDCDKGCGTRYIVHVYPFEDVETAQNLFLKLLGADCPSHALEYGIDANKRKVTAISS